jgi:UDP-N-acetylmuramate dehydrogenase
MQVQENFPLKRYNTFGIDAKAHRFAAFHSGDELAQLLELTGGVPFLILGGGSNILLTKDISGWVLKNEIAGIEKVREDDDYVYIKAGAGENWHRFVMHCIEHNWAGVENLSLIPGCVGASPMQNIGAYGVEIKDVFHELQALHVKDHSVHTFDLAACEFGYRESVFKRKLKGQYIILSVTYRLRKHPVLNTSYGAINDELAKMGIKEPNIRAISDAVMRIRSSKLPDPAEIGNAGSFFKNPSVTKQHYDELKTSYPSIVGYSNPDGSVKLAAGWLIEQAGWKGYRKGDAGVHAKQALVLVNYGLAKGNEIYELSSEVLESIKEKFGVELEREVNLIS